MAFLGNAHKHIMEQKVYVMDGARRAADSVSITPSNHPEPRARNIKGESEFSTKLLELQCRPS